MPDTLGLATQPQIALERLGQLVTAGLVKAPVLADRAYGNNGDFRAGLQALNLEFFLQIDPRQLLAWGQPVAVEKQRTRWHVRAGEPPARPLVELFTSSKAVRWPPCSWKAADGQTRHTRLAWMRVYLPAPLDRGADHLAERWLVVDWPEGQAEPYHSYLAQRQREPTRARSLHLSRSRWNLEPYFQRGKDDLGWDHFEGRSGRGFHHHWVLAVLAYLFVVVVQRRAKKTSAVTWEQTLAQMRPWVVR